MNQFVRKSYSGLKIRSLRKKSVAMIFPQGSHEEVHFSYGLCRLSKDLKKFWQKFGNEPTLSQKLQRFENPFSEKKQIGGYDCFHKDRMKRSAFLTNSVGSP
jgi:hypothetical protein